MTINFIKSNKPTLSPCPGSDWAQTMVLNPAIIRDKKNPQLIHMLFRATGPYTHKQEDGKPLPYPIFLGYAKSEDNGASWDADFTRPALAPDLKTEINEMYITNHYGEKCVNYANGCIEDPRLVDVEGEVFLTTACRLFAPGPYWEKDDPVQCAPAWIHDSDQPFGRAAKDNVTVNVLWKVDLEALYNGMYENAFEYYCHLSDPELGEDRDVFPFPEKMNINGRKQYVMLTRPFTPETIEGFEGANVPSIFIAAAEDWRDFAKHPSRRSLLAKPEFTWEFGRIGASSPPIKVEDGRWLLPYHGKQDSTVGYTQSFMILQENGTEVLDISHRCSDRPLIVTEGWEQPGRFPTPCVFTTAMIEHGDEYMISYGAADEFCGVCTVNREELVSYVMRYSPTGIATENAGV